MTSLREIFPAVEVAGAFLKMDGDARKSTSGNVRRGQLIRISPAFRGQNLRRSA